MRWRYVARLVLAASLFTGACSTAPERAVGDPPAAQWGIEVEGLRLSAAGYMLDFRYRVEDEERARRLIRPGLKPYILVNASGVRLDVPVSPKLGPLRQTRARVVADKTYFVFFANPARMVRAGDQVAVVMGDLRIENLVVQ